MRASTDDAVAITCANCGERLRPTNNEIVNFEHEATSSSRCQIFARVDDESHDRLVAWGEAAIAAAPHGHTLDVLRALAPMCCPYCAISVADIRRAGGRASVSETRCAIHAGKRYAHDGDRPSVTT